LEKAFVETYRLTKTFNAPLGFVYNWCTDFREDDLKMVGSKTRRMILEHTRKHVVWRIVAKGGTKGYQGIRSVWLNPPNRWHLDTSGDKHLTGDYKLTRLGKARTRLDMRFTETNVDRRKLEPRKSWEADTMSEWDAYARCLERDYQRYLRTK
jgi:hypothetical protein